MNRLLQHYQVDVEFPHVSGFEHLEMLSIRDELADMVPLLTKPEQEALAAADRRLLEQAAAFYTELARFVDLRQRRQADQIPPSRWWWYLDVLAQLPTGAVVSAPESLSEVS